jgi:hypothetical protein
VRIGGEAVVTVGRAELGVGPGSAADADAVEGGAVTTSVDLDEAEGAVAGEVATDAVGMAIPFGNEACPPTEALHAATNPATATTTTARSDALMVRR